MTMQETADISASHTEQQIDEASKTSGLDDTPRTSRSRHHPKGRTSMLEATGLNNLEKALKPVEGSAESSEHLSTNKPVPTHKPASTIGIHEIPEESDVLPEVHLSKEDNKIPDSEVNSRAAAESLLSTPSDKPSTNAGSPSKITSDETPVCEDAAEKQKKKKHLPRGVKPTLNDVQPVSRRTHDPELEVALAAFDVEHVTEPQQHISSGESCKPQLNKRRTESRPNSASRNQSSPRSAVAPISMAPAIISSESIAPDSNSPIPGSVDYHTPIKEYPVVDTPTELEGTPKKPRSRHGPRHNTTDLTEELSSLGTHSAMDSHIGVLSPSIINESPVRAPNSPLPPVAVPVTPLLNIRGKDKNKSFEEPSSSKKLRLPVTEPDEIIFEDQDIAEASVASLNISRSGTDKGDTTGTEKGDTTASPEVQDTKNSRSRHGPHHNKNDLDAPLSGLCSKGIPESSKSAPESDSSALYAFTSAPALEPTPQSMPSIQSPMPSLNTKKPLEKAHGRSIEAEVPVKVAKRKSNLPVVIPQGEEMLFDYEKAIDTLPSTEAAPYATETANPSVMPPTIVIQTEEQSNKKSRHAPRSQKSLFQSVEPTTQVKKPVTRSESSDNFVAMLGSADADVYQSVQPSPMGADIILDEVTAPIEVSPALVFNPTAKKSTIPAKSLAKKISTKKQPQSASILPPVEAEINFEIPDDEPAPSTPPHTVPLDTAPEIAFSDNETELPFKETIPIVVAPSSGTVGKRRHHASKESPVKQVAPHSVNCCTKEDEGNEKDKWTEVLASQLSATSMSRLDDKSIAATAPQVAVSDLLGNTNKPKTKAVIRDYSKKNVPTSLDKEESSGVRLNFCCVFISHLQRKWRQARDMVTTMSVLKAMGQKPATDGV